MLKLKPTCALSVLELALSSRYNSRSRPVITTRELRAAVRRKSQCWLSWKAFLGGPVPPPHVIPHVVSPSLPAPGPDSQRKGADMSHECLLHGPDGCRLRDSGSHSFLQDVIMAMAYPAHQSGGHVTFASSHSSICAQPALRGLFAGSCGASMGGEVSILQSSRTARSCQFMEGSVGV